MVQLICMRCNHANEAGAKFCGDCGAGLLRRFCRQCHAVNDAASHFCQSCGVALPDSKSTPQPGGSPPLRVPSLTDVAFDDPVSAPATSLHVALPDRGALVALPAHGAPPEAEAPAVAERDTARIYRAPIVLAAAGVLAMMVAVWVWPSSERAVVSARDSAARSMSAAVVLLPAGVPQTAAASETETPGRTDEALSRADVPTTAAPQPIARIKEAGNIGARRPATEARPAPRAAASEEAVPVVRAAARPAAPRPAVPAPECTPQVDALGLCAPGAGPQGR